jgi:sarcosine oxidase
MGSAAAWWLARRGRDVVLVEQFEAGHHRGSSHGGSRIFRYGYDDPTYVRLAQEAFPLWRELEDDAGETLLELTGAVEHGDPASVKAVADAFEDCGVEHAWVPNAEASERWPAMTFDGDVLFHPGGGRCLADATVAALQRRAADHGADVRFATGHARIEVASNDHVDVFAGDQRWRAPVVVVAAGAWVANVLAGTPAAARLPAPTVTQEQVQHYVPRDGDIDREWPSFIHHREPWVYGLRTPGEGIKIAEHHVGPRVDPDARPPRQLEAEAVVNRYVQQWFPGLDPTPVHTVECLYTTLPGEEFVLERVGPIVIGSACSGHGFKFTPAIGRRLADLAIGAAQ